VAKNSSAEQNGSAMRPYAMRRFDETPAEKVVVSKAEAPEAALKRRENEATERGYQAGLEKGMADAQERMEPVIGRLLQILEELENAARRKGEQLLPELIELSIEVAEKVIHKSLEVDREIVVSIAQDALARISNAGEQVIVRVNPADFAVLESRIARLKEASGIKHIVLEPHESILPGGCYIEAASGAVDARIDEQLKEVSGAIRTALDS
jgi:flagellar assembly protein FliH